MVKELGASELLKENLDKKSSEIILLKDMEYFIYGRFFFLMLYGDNID